MTRIGATIIIEENLIHQIPQGSQLVPSTRNNSLCKQINQQKPNTSHMGIELRKDG